MATKAALARIDELEGEEWTRDDTIERMRGDVPLPQAPASRRAPGTIEDDEGFEDRSAAYQTLVREVLEAQRREIVRLRNDGRRSPTTSCTGSSASSTWRTSGSRSE